MEQYIGIPYVVGGRTMAGLDCYGLVWLAEKELFGVSLPSFVYGAEDDSVRLFSDNRPMIKAQEVHKPKDGDIVLLFIHGVPQHIGLCIGGGVLHSTKRNGVVWEKLESPFMHRFNKKEFYRV